MKINDILHENDRRDFLKKAVAGAGALALGSIAVPSKAWPSELPQDFNFMDQFLSDKVLNDPKYKEFKLRVKPRCEFNFKERFGSYPQSLMKFLINPRNILKKLSTIQTKKCWVM